METMSLTQIEKESIEKHQCSGCVLGGPDICNSFSKNDEDGKIYKGIYRCKSHRPGTTMSGIGVLALGMPKGFNRYGASLGTEYYNTEIWNGESETFEPEWDDFNIPIWALEKDKYLYIRVYSPRINNCMIFAILDGKMDKICPTAIDVSKFYDEID